MYDFGKILRWEEWEEWEEWERGITPYVLISKYSVGFVEFLRKI